MPLVGVHQQKFPFLQLLGLRFDLQLQSALQHIDDLGVLVEMRILYFSRIKLKVHD